MNKDLQDIWDVAWFNEINAGEKLEMLYSKIEYFCNKWKAYAPSLCQWLKEKGVEPLGHADWVECFALFDSDMKRANKLYKRDMHKKEIIDAGSEFHI